MALNFQRVRDFSAGMDTERDAAAIPMNAHVELLNTKIDKQGRAEARAGVVGRGGAGATGSGMGLFDPPEGTTRILAFYPPDIYHSTMNNVWSQTACGTSLVDGLHALAFGRDIVNRWFAFPYTVDGDDTTTSFSGASCFNWVDPDDGTASQLADFRPRVLTFWQGRMWAADSRATDHYPDQLWWSNIFDGTEFSLPSAMNIRIDPANGGAITAVVPARDVDPRLYIFKDTGIYQAAIVWGTDGLIPLTANDLDTTQALVRPLTVGLGNIAPMAATWVPMGQGSDLYFFSQDGIRSLRRAEQDVSAGAGGPPLTTKIQSWIDRINFTYARRIWAAVHKNFYYCAVPLDGATYNTHILVKNTLTGPFEGWSVWPLGAAAFTIADIPQRRLFFMGSTGFSETLAGESTATLMTHIYELDNDAGLLDPGGSLPTKRIDSRAFDAGIPGRRKYWRWCEVQYDMQDDGATLSLYARRNDDADWGLVGHQYVEPATGYPVLPAALPWQYISEGEFGTVKFGLDSIGPSYRLALRLEDSGPGRLNIRQFETVFRAMPKEWE